MKKTITKEQIDAIAVELKRLNVPVQSFEGIIGLLNSLPDIQEKVK